MVSVISYALGSSFAGVKIYKEQVKQIKRPAFFVRSLEAVQDRHIGNLYTREVNFVIRHFLAEDNESNYKELEEIVDKLYSVLEFMEYKGKKLRGFNMKHNIEDNVLQFFVSCKWNLRKPENNPLIKSLETDLRIKKG